MCQHIAHYYQNVGGDPAVFYYLDPAQLPANYTIIETLSDTGDECHREVVDVSNSALKKRFKGIPIDQFFICDGSGARPLTPVDIAVFREAYG